MSTVLWIKLENDAEDFAPDDLFELFLHLEELDDRCAQLDVKPLGEFVDYSDIEYNFLDDDELDELEDGPPGEDAKWLDAAEVIATLNAIAQDLGTDDEKTPLLEELRYTLERCTEAEREGVRVRLVAVM